MLRVSVGAEPGGGLCIMSYKAHFFYFDYQNKRTKCHRLSAAIRIGHQYVCPVGSNMHCPNNNMPSLKRSNMYWSTNMSFFKRSNMFWPINRSSLKSSNMYCSTNISSRNGSNMHWLHQYPTKFNIIYNTYWNSYRIVQGMTFHHTRVYPLKKWQTFTTFFLLFFFLSPRFRIYPLLIRRDHALAR